MATKADARALNLGNGVTNSSQNLTVNINTELEFNSGILRVGRDGWIDVTVTAGTSSISIPLSANYQTYDVVIDYLGSSANANCQYGLDYGSGVQQTGTYRRQMTYTGATTTFGCSQNIDNYMMVHNTASNNAVNFVTMVLHNEPGIKRLYANTAFFDGTNNYTAVVYGHDSNNQGTKATNLVIVLSTGTFVSGGHIRFRPRLIK